MAIDVDAHYRTYGPMVLRRCRRLLSNEDEAVDAMQETFVHLPTYASLCWTPAPRDRSRAARAACASPPFWSTRPATSVDTRF